MIKTKSELSVTEILSGDKKAFSLFDLREFDGKADSLKQFSYVELESGQSVGYHVHEGDQDFYYIISGSGIYNDNGKEIAVESGTITFTPSGEGHDLTNTGKEKLCFIALVVKN